jgi:hypothetical protein
MIYKKYDLVRLYLMTIFMKFKKHLIVFLMMIVLTLANDTGKTHKISNVFKDTLYIGETCNALKTCLWNFHKKSTLNRTQSSFEFFRMFNNGVRIVKIQLIANFPCDNACRLRCKQT